MKKIAIFIFMFSLLMLTAMTVYAESKFDKSNVSKGILTVTYDGKVSGQTILMIKLKGNSSQYTYPIRNNNPMSVPLQMGDGQYTALIAETTGGGRARVIKSEEFSAKITSPNDMYLLSTAQVNFTKNMQVIKAYASALKALGGESEKIAQVYEDIVTQYSYDQPKADQLSGKTGYFPNIDDFYVSKKGICYDYASTMASILRSHDIPTKLVMGFAPEIDTNHAWNEIFINGEWVVVDSTYDSAYANAGRKYKMEKDASLFKANKIY